MRKLRLRANHRLDSALPGLLVTEPALDLKILCALVLMLLPLYIRGFETSQSIVSPTS